MKTNQHMLRKMGNFNVTQRTKDGMFNATTLLKQWNKHSGQKKDVAHFFENNSTNELISAIQESENFNSRKSVFLKSAGRYGGTWMHPYLFIDFAMWLNPTFKLHVIKFVHDQLIAFRHKAGDNYRGFCSAVLKIEPKIDFKEPAKWLNYVVFDQHGQNLRQHATEEQIKDLAQLEQKYTTLIEEGYIHSVEVLKSKLRNEYAKRHHIPEILKAS